MEKKIYFSGLDGLRFISISFVVIHHLFTFKNYYGLTSFNSPVIGSIGYYGIQFFFAGSGFLITYLLLSEYNKYGKISLKSFYIRRILRIWPAYYLLIFLALVVFLQFSFFHIPFLTDGYLASDFKKGNLLYFSFLPHIVPFYYPTTPFVHQTYTIGIEEQFYFIWGFLFFLAAKYVKWIFLIVLISAPILNFFHSYFYESYIQSNPKGVEKYFFMAVTFIKYSRFSTFAIGSLFAVAFFLKKRWINVFKSIYTQIAVYTILVISIIFDFSIPYFRDEYIAIIMLSVFLIANFKNESLLNYDVKWLSFLGKISYGIYLFHIFAIVIAIKICTLFFHFKMNNYWQMLVLIVMTMFLAILFGLISYFTVEKYFLNLKSRFKKVRSY
jgi:peptidoglycan/LPS O-acetylase OafA/YrhL